MIQLSSNYAPYSYGNDSIVNKRLERLLMLLHISYGPFRVRDDHYCSS